MNSMVGSAPGFLATLPWRLLLAAITALVVGVLGAGSVSAAALPELGNRVGASTPTTAYLVGVHESISAGQLWGHAPPQGVSVVGSCVAAKTVDNVAETAAKACSFSGATLVLMADGTKKPIEDVQVGDEVIATDPETGEQVAKTVEHVFVHDDTVTDLVVDGEVISTTEDHPFWSVTDQRFERADQLDAGEQVLGADGRFPR